MNSISPTLSVCVPNYNHAGYLEQALNSVLKQSFHPTEIVVMDDASTDHSWELIQRFAREHPLIRPLRNEQNLGVIGTLNRLLLEARGGYVHFLAADDFLLSGFYERAMRLLSAHPTAGFCCSHLAKLIDKSQAFFPDSSHLSAVWGYTERYFSPQDLIELPSSGLLHGNTIVINRAALLAAGGYRKELRWNTDWFANWVVAMRHGLCFQPEPLAVCRISDGQYSKGMKRWAEQREVIRAMLRLLKTAEYADVRPAFSESGILATLVEFDVARTALETPDLLDDDTRQLVCRMLERGRDWGVERARYSQIYLSCYSPQYLRPRVRELVSRWQARDARVVIFGAGEHTSNLFRWTNLSQARIVGLVDSNSFLVGESFWSLEVRRPSELKRLDPDVVLLSSASSQQEMYRVAATHVRADAEIVRLYENCDAPKSAPANDQPGRSDGGSS